MSSLWMIRPFLPPLNPLRFFFRSVWLPADSLFAVPFSTVDWLSVVSNLILQYAHGGGDARVMRDAQKGALCFARGQLFERRAA